jgi:hypothetical protein
MDGQVTPFDELALESNQREPHETWNKKWSSQQHIIHNMHHIVCWLRLREWCGPAGTSFPLFFLSFYSFLFGLLIFISHKQTNQIYIYIYIYNIWSIQIFDSYTHTHNPAGASPPPIRLLQFSLDDFWSHQWDTQWDQQVHQRSESWLDEREPPNRISNAIKI